MEGFFPLPKLRKIERILVAFLVFPQMINYTRRRLANKQSQDLPSCNNKNAHHKSWPQKLHVGDVCGGCFKIPKFMEHSCSIQVIAEEPSKKKTGQIEKTKCQVLLKIATYLNMPPTNSVSFGECMKACVWPPKRTKIEPMMYITVNPRAIQEVDFQPFLVYKPSLGMTFNQWSFLVPLIGAYISSIPPIKGTRNSYWFKHINTQINLDLPDMRHFCLLVRFLCGEFRHRF